MRFPTEKAHSGHILGEVSNIFREKCLLLHHIDLIQFATEPGYFEHSTETETGSIKREFVIWELLIRQFKSERMKNCCSI